MITRGWAFKVYSDPKPKGSLKPTGRVGQRVRLVEQVDNKAWRAAVGMMARQHVQEQAAPHQAIRAQMVFTLARPKSHYGARGLRPTAPLWPTAHGTGDVDKLARLVYDALEEVGVLWNDSQVVREHNLKVYPDTPVEGALAADVLTHPGAFVRLWPYGAL